MHDEPQRESSEEADIPWQQKLFDDVFLLILAGLVVPTIFYIIWGLWSLSNVPHFAP